MRQRQDFIRAHLEAFGQIRRADIAERFDITLAVASSDINMFLSFYPEAIIYDGRAKTYVLDRQHIKEADDAA